MTGGFSHPDIRTLLNGMVNTIDPVAILMKVQAGNGKGEKPEAFNVCGGDFEFPTSEGYPNWRWCENLYFSETNQWPEDVAKWVHVFPTLQDKVSEFHDRWAPMKPVMAVTDITTAPIPEDPRAKRLTPFDRGPVQVEFSALEVGLIEPPDEFRDAPEMHPGAAKPSPKREPAKAGGRSAILDIVPTEEGRKEVPAKRLPDSAALLEKLFQTAAPPVRPREKHRIAYLEDATPITRWEIAYHALQEARGDSWVELGLWQTPVLPLVEVAQKLGISEPQAAATCRRNGYYVLGKKTQIVSRVPLNLENPGEKRQQEKQKAQNSTWAGVVGRSTASVQKAVERAKAIPAEMPEVVVEVIKAVPLRPLENPPPITAPELLANTVQANKLIIKWASRNVQVGKGLKAQTLLAIGTEMVMTEVARVIGPNSSANRKALAEWALDQLCAGPPIPPSRSSQKEKNRLKRRQEELRQRGDAPTWAEEAEEHWFTVAGKPVFSAVAGKLKPGPKFETVASLGWTTIDGAAAAPYALQPVRRGRESENAFLLRVKRLLESEGLTRVRFESPNDSPQPPPKTQCNGQETKKQEASRKAPAMSTKAPKSQPQKKQRRR